ISPSPFLPTLSALKAMPIYTSYQNITPNMAALKAVSFENGIWYASACLIRSPVKILCNDPSFVNLLWVNR
ncbi:hypothetical protein, partial [Acinetobacter radioresistens]|uniref:hypothetical protein n=1 Tax=Acinetobacter radioresistens TaxID=40216 RepID=UPI001C2D9A0E